MLIPKGLPLQNSIQGPLGRLSTANREISQTNLIQLNLPASKSRTRAASKPPQSKRPKEFAFCAQHEASGLMAIVTKPGEASKQYSEYHRGFKHCSLGTRVTSPGLLILADSCTPKIRCSVSVPYPKKYTPHGYLLIRIAYHSARNARKPPANPRVPA